ncbi:acyl-CoA synthetase [Acidimicrobiia bacterium EGI L10123]|uniref:acyl-CoA synthetase n=1 Tax=Salinilacustrithrix flava TaxID=2957203 RepID=UPI003D7C2024|nr:acyl-CoA synthetase [Acidimicrobiia bacterium EGI L10123]
MPETHHEGAEDVLRRHGDRLAAVLSGSGETRTYAELDERSTRLARHFDRAGLAPGDHVAVLLRNQLEYVDVIWASLRAGLYLTPINWHLGPDEAGYIVEDCGATALVTAADMAEVVDGWSQHLRRLDIRLSVGAGIDGFADFEEALSASDPTPREGEREGQLMLYSSGTTGRPKGILPPLPRSPFGQAKGGITPVARGLYGMDASSVYLSPAPMYHAAPLGWTIAAHRLGATVVIMERFDGAEALDAIERHRVTHAQFVPTHFVRMLRLPEEVRSRADLSSLQKVIHAAAPCPVPVKQQMIDWVGPIVDEYYGGSEGFGFCNITAHEWLEHPGSVGRSMLGAVHIVGEDGTDVGPGETGQVWFEAAGRFEYHNDPAKTRRATDPRGWATYGDIGHVDDDGYLHLTDRASNMIISGGVNIYPQEAENVLTVHPDVHDVAVLGVPDPEMGERVKAFVVAVNAPDDPDRLAAELIEHCRDELAHYKCPRELVFVDELPRLESGKLLKRRLLEEIEVAT